MIIWLLAGVALCFGLGAWLGAPYLPILGQDTDQLLDLAAVKAGETLLDLGCGDGRLLRAAARRGVHGIGYEINPLVFAVAWLSCWPQRKFISIRFGNYWHVSWPAADVIYVFLIERYMAKLERALTSRIARPTRVVSYVFELPNRKPVRSTKNAWLYHYPILVN